MFAWVLSYQIAERLPVMQSPASFFDTITNVSWTVSIERNHLSVRDHSLVRLGPIDARQAPDVGIGKHVVSITSCVLSALLLLYYARFDNRPPCTMPL